MSCYCLVCLLLFVMCFVLLVSFFVVVLFLFCLFDLLASLIVFGVSFFVGFVVLCRCEALETCAKLPLNVAAVVLLSFVVVLPVRARCSQVSV